MHDENGREYVRTEAIPSWMAQAAKAIIPTAFIAVVVAGLVTWQSVAVLASRVGQLEDFAKQGNRFTSIDGDKLERRISALEQWRMEHSIFGYEYVGKRDQQIRELFGRVDKLEKRHDKQ